MKFWLFFLLVTQLFAEHAIVYVHVGPMLPSYLPAAIDQARLFNPNCPIYVIGNEAALAALPGDKAVAVACESLQPSAEHMEFQTRDRNSGLFRYASERFYYLEEFVRARGLRNVFHMENDVMLFVELEKMLPVFSAYYEGKLGLTLDNDERCIPGFVYVADGECLGELVKFMASRVDSGAFDMFLLAQFHNATGGKWSSTLPIILPSYAELRSNVGHVPREGAAYSNHFGEFQGIFDAACLGQYWKGIDPNYHANSKPGFINESCLFNPAFLRLEWIRDEQGRAVPHFRYKEELFPIFNLHINCKDLAAFFSLNRDLPPPPEPPKPIEKVRYALTVEPIDAVIVCPARDSLLDRCIESVRPFVRRVVVVSPEPFSDRAEWFDEKKLPFSRAQIGEELFHGDKLALTRFQYQARSPLQRLYRQLSKLYAPRLIPDLSSNVLVLESDAFFTSANRWMNEKGEPIFTASKTSFPPFASLFLTQIEPSWARTSLVQRPILEDLFAQLGEPWKAICQLDKGLFSQPSFSAFDLYSYFALLRTEQVKMVK